MLFGQFHYLSVHTGHWWSVLRWKVLFRSEQCSASFSTGNGVLWDGESRKRFLSPIFHSNSKLTFYSTCHRDLYQIRWSNDSDLWHGSRWYCQSPKCGGRSRKEVQKTIIWIYLSTTCRCLLRRQVLVSIVPKCTLNVQPCADLHTPETGKHQIQVKVLIEKTASSLDDTALKMLFVSVQQNNLELCIQYAIELYVCSCSHWWGDLTLIFSAWPTRLGSLVLSVLVITIQMTVLGWNWFRRIWYTVQCYGLGIHLWVNAWFTELGINPLWNSYQWVSVNIHFRRASVEADEKKGYVRPIMIVTCAGWDWHLVQNVSAIFHWMIMKIRLMKWWQYVCGIPFTGCLNSNKFSFKGKTVRQ